MDEAKFIREFMELTSCSEATARSVYIHAEALRADEANVQPAAEDHTDAAAPAGPASEPAPKPNQPAG